MVPSDPGDSLFSGRHARLERGIRQLGAIVASLHLDAFSHPGFIARQLAGSTCR
jgi:hypothetical protein